MRQSLALLGLADCTLANPLGGWDLFADMPLTPRSNLVAAALNGTLYAIGGYGGSSSGTSYLKDGASFDPLTGNWSAIAPMSTARDAPGVGVLNGKIYIVGGGDQLPVPQKSGEVFDPGSNTWSGISNMSTARYLLGAAALNGKIYAVGGNDGSSALKSVEAFDPLTNSWGRVADMPFARQAPGVVALNGILYAIGGYGTTYLSSSVSFDPLTGNWSAIALMHAARYAPGAAVLNGKIYVVGGDDGGTTGSIYKSGEVFDPATNSWSIIADMSTPRLMPGTTSLNGRVYAVGGKASIYLQSVEAYAPPAGYSCNTTSGRCELAPNGTEAAQDCIATCECVAPHNCGYLNGTMQCGAVLAGCNVCDSCCQTYFHQHSCDGCFAAPVSEQGCGGK
jgi:N-acetylneuraminic acid mutarotase